MKTLNKAKLTTALCSAVEAAFKAGGPIIVQSAGYRDARRTVQSFQRYAETTVTTFSGKVVVDGHKDGYPFAVLVTWSPVRDRRASAWVRSQA